MPDRRYAAYCKACMLQNKFRIRFFQFLACIFFDSFFINPVCAACDD